MVNEEKVNSIPSTCQWRPEGVWFLGPRIWMRQTQCLHAEPLRNSDLSKMRCCGCTCTYHGHQCPSEHILPQQACLCCREFTTSSRLAPSSRKHVVFKTAHTVTSHHQVLCYTWLKESFGEVGSPGASTHLKLNPSRTLRDSPRDRLYPLPCPFQDSSHYPLFCGLIFS